MKALPPAQDLGVVSPAKPEHLHWVRGTCASVRRFMGDTPIRVVFDGESFPDDLRDHILVVIRDEVEQQPGIFYGSQGLRDDHDLPRRRLDPMAMRLPRIARAAQP